MKRKYIYKLWVRQSYLFCKTFLFLVNFIFGCLLPFRYSAFPWYLREFLLGGLSGLIWPCGWASGALGLLTFRN